MVVTWELAYVPISQMAMVGQNIAANLHLYFDLPLLSVTVYEKVLHSICSRGLSIGIYKHFFF